MAIAEALHEALREQMVREVAGGLPSNLVVFIAKRLKNTQFAYFTKMVAVDCKCNGQRKRFGATEISP